MALPPRLFCDTSFFYACFDQHDVNHQQADDLSKKAAALWSPYYDTLKFSQRAQISRPESLDSSTLHPATNSAPLKIGGLKTRAPFSFFASFALQ